MHQEPSTWEHHSPNAIRYLTATSQTNHELKIYSIKTTSSQKKRTTQTDTAAIVKKI